MANREDTSLALVVAGTMAQGTPLTRQTLALGASIEIDKELPREVRVTREYAMYSTDAHPHLH